ncbi:hypothetical protein FRC12_021690 [Ceratobasidium sp. 428]|nr:hypothetical protein FRC12_021690 [Ceratobasidium sp. 428]
MFFARLAIAALSFGPVAKVFAAPIAVAVDVPPVVGVSVDAVGVPVERRLDLTLPDMLNATTTTLGGLKKEVDALVNDPTAVVTGKLAAALNTVGSTVGELTQKLRVAGVNTDSLLTNDDGAKLTTDQVADSFSSVLEPVNGIVNSVQGSSNLDGLQTPLNTIKANLSDFDAALEAILPEVHSTVAKTVAAVLGLINGLLGGLLGGNLGLGLLAGISPPA